MSRPKLILFLDIDPSKEVCDFCTKMREVYIYMGKAMRGGLKLCTDCYNLIKNRERFKTSDQKQVEVIRKRNSNYMKKFRKEHPNYVKKEKQNRRERYEKYEKKKIQDARKESSIKKKILPTKEEWKNIDIEVSKT